MKSDNQRKAESNARKRERGLYQTSIWVHESWRSTELLQRLKQRLSKPRVGK